MRKLACLVFFLIASLAFMLPAEAIKTKGSDDYIKIDISAPVTVKADNYITLSLIMQNQSFDKVNTISSMCYSVTDPWTGTRIAGPACSTINQVLQGAAWNLVNNNWVYTPGQSATKALTVKIPATVGSHSTANKMLGMVIYLLDPNAAVCGVTAWGFAVVP